jgi:hypothetical protein
MLALNDAWVVFVAAAQAYARHLNSQPQSSRAVHVRVFVHTHPRHFRSVAATNPQQTVHVLTALDVKQKQVQEMDAGLKQNGVQPLVRMAFTAPDHTMHLTSAEFGPSVQTFE